MASLKEVKDRIDSVSSTKKITSAMKMIASSKLRRSQQAINSFLPYSTKLNDILINLLASDNNIESDYSQKREPKRVAIVVFTSNSSLCGAFNANVLKELSHTISEIGKKVNKDNITIYPIGKKATTFVKKRHLQFVDKPELQKIVDKPQFFDILGLSKELVDAFLAKEYDEIILIYTHFKSMGVQRVARTEYLPFDLKMVKENLQSDNSLKKNVPEYILEPSRKDLLIELIPKVLASNLFAALLDSNASENAARSLAMQVATDNANDLIQDLTIEYNKNRQAAITNELLDIIGGAAALDN